MALKIHPSITPPTTGVDYGAHLGSAVSKPITSMTSFEKKNVASGITQSETLHPGVITDGHSITVEASQTLNLGNYESARMGVSLTVPCDKTTLNDAYDWATSWVSTRIEQAVKDAKEGK